MGRKRKFGYYPRVEGQDSTMIRAFGYLRTSTDEQELGLDVQKAEIEKWSLRNKIPILHYYTDQGVSGSTDPVDRPAMSQLLCRLDQGGVDYILVAKYDRLSRETMITGFLELTCSRVGVKILTPELGVEEELSPEQQAMRGMAAVFAQLEKRLIARRTKGALAELKKRGVPLGRRKRLSYRENCKLFYVIQYLQKYGETVDFTRGYLASVCNTTMSENTVSRYRTETEVPMHFPIREVVDALKPYYEQGNGKHVLSSVAAARRAGQK